MKNIQSSYEVNGIIGKLIDEEPIIFCNEKDEKRGKFLFKCCDDCVHNKKKCLTASTSK